MGMITIEGPATPAQASTEGTPEGFRRWLALWDSLVARSGLPAAVGIVMLLVTGTTVLGTLPLQAPDADQWHQVSIISGAMASIVLSAVVLPWPRWSVHVCLLFPASTLMGLWALSVTADGLGAAYIGVFMLTFVYVGLFLPPHTCWWLLVPAAALYGPTAGGWSKEIGLRLTVIAIMWMLIAELLAALSARSRSALAALHAASRTDHLTSLANRRALEEYLHSATAGTVFAVCDLDHFKKVNDTHGHTHGDQVLADFARVLQDAVRHADHAVRYGGEEFLLMLRLQHDAVPQVLARLHQQWSLVHADITFSCGWAVHTDERSVQETLAAADRALYRAKHSGRDRDVAEDRLSPALPS
jgi:diguanylate cyclase (GGDEF)-like protein